MRILLIRHAEAVNASGPRTDGHRHLTASGRETARRVGAALREMGLKLDGVLTSPLVRAVQTSELIATTAGFGRLVEVLPALAPGYPALLAAEALGAAGSCVALVGHAPTISDLGAILVQRPSFPPLRTAQVCAIEDGHPRWTLNPSTMEKEPLLVA